MNRPVIVQSICERYTPGSMVAITAFDAKTRFGELLERVARGEAVVITRHGRPIARITPVEAPDLNRRRAAIARLQSFGRGQTLGGLSVRELVDEGRR